MRGVDVWHGDSINESSKLEPIPEKAYKESDFCIVKATQGTSYKYTGFFHKMIERVLIDGKLAGAFHYAAGGDPKKEADYFISVVKTYLGQIILCLDWEGMQNKAYGSKTWCKDFIDRVKEKTGITCFLYVNDEGIKHYASLAGKVPLWFAGYPKPMSTSWDVPKFKYDLGKWGKYQIWQYTSSKEKIDRNISPLTREQWLNYAKATIPVKLNKGPELVTDSTEITGTQLREDVANVLCMLKGVKEGSQEHKLIIDKFNQSGLCPRYKMTTKDAWCATAVSFAFIVTGLAGKPGSGALFQCVECSCAKMIELAKKQGIWYENDAHVPKTGDVIMYDWDDTGKGDNKGTPNHTGIVKSVVDDMITVVEGNKNDAVGERKIKINAKTIRGYILPKYSEYVKESKETTSKNTKASYYPKYSGKSDSIVDALKSIGVKNPTLDFRKKIAKANDISGYTGLASQNNTLLTLLKAGKLKKA